ncbi:MAG: hypothetical protein WBL80_01715 [Erysipelotrichaceae bacterium]
MATKLKIVVIFLVIIATMFIGSKGVVKESESASQLLESTKGVWLSTFYENFTSDQYPKYNDQVPYKNKLTNFNELVGAAADVYEVETISRKYYDPVMQTKCRIKKVFKSNPKGQGIDDIIYIYEHYSVSHGLNSGIMLFSPIFPMHEVKRYIVFVNQVEGYNKRDHYNLVSSVYGIIPIKSSIKITESDQFNVGFDPWPIDKFENIDYIIENIDKAKSTLIEEQIASRLFDLEAQKANIKQKDYQEQREEIADKYSALAYSITYKETLKSIVSDALKTYYDMNVEFIEK